MRLLIWSGAIAILCMPSLPRAQVLEEIAVRRVGDTAEIEVFFNLRVRYLRHFPLDRGDTLRVFVALMPVNGVIPLMVQDFRTSPPNELIPPFTLMFPDRGALRIEFATPVSFKVGPGSDARSIRIRVPLPPAKLAPDKGAVGVEKPAAGIALGMPGEVTPVPPTRAPPADTRVAPPVDTAAAPSTELDVEAGKLMAQARASIDAGDNATAIDTLNRLLNLPPNRFSKEAQELAGVARQLHGEIAKARAEYELYLKLYPDDEGAVRVRDRLAGLGAIPAEGEREVGPLGKERGTETMFYGIARHCYRP